ncbi:protein HID1-like [Orbicella faveolata]|uniref:protein HID1-like n=1 Tax=Orbicella faveolata TaxID=48498 RepID=UPI0009E61B6E|nr:protein HID1-like [Orbicella faveolata]
MGPKGGPCVEKLQNATLTGCSGPNEQLSVLNCVRLLTRFVPYIFEDPDWRGFFWSTVPGQEEENFHLGDEEAAEARPPLAQTLLSSLADLCFCPEFTVHPPKKTGPDQPEDLSSIDSCEYIWEAGVGFATSPPSNPQFDCTRTELLKLLLTCFSEAMYLPPTAENHCRPNKWLSFFSSSGNRHALPIFTSLLNIVCCYDPLGYGVPYNHLMFADYREPLVEVAAQLLVVLLDHETMQQAAATMNGTDAEHAFEEPPVDNLFCNYLSRIHREEDFYFVLHGIANLLNNPLIQTYLPNSCKKVSFHQELLVLFWKMCDQNKKFLFYVLKSSDVLDILVPILFHLNDARSDQSRLGLMHIGVFILLLLSGERNFGVRLNKPYSVRVPMDIPVFTGTHADFLVIVFHKIITNGHQRLQPLFDCLLTIIVNVSPYLKSLSMVAANKLLHLLEAFSTPWFLFSNATNHHLVFFLLEIFNNIIQYQFDGNSHLVYAIIRKRNIFHQLANLPTDPATVQKPRRRLTSQGSDREAQASISEGEEKKPGKSTSASENMPEMSADMSVKEVRNPASESESSDVEARSVGDPTPPSTPGTSRTERKSIGRSASVTSSGPFVATPEWVQSWKQKLPLQTIMRMLQVLVPQVEKICIDKLSVKEVRNPASESESSDVEARSVGDPTPPSTPGTSRTERKSIGRSASVTSSGPFVATPEWVQSWKQKLPLQTIMRMLQVLVPQVEKICIDKTMERFMKHAVREIFFVDEVLRVQKERQKQCSAEVNRYLCFSRNIDPPIWYDTDVKLFEIQRV